jgi:[NiFe] hydrogenase assembly HybE family chaperone
MTPDICRYATSPATTLEAVFRDIERTRMAGLPILHPALAVEAVGFEPLHGHWLGVLITPWFMNAMIVPGAQADWLSVAEGAWVDWRLPVGDLRFYCMVEPGLGEVHAHSLYSPVTRFADPAAARAEAQRCLSLLRAAPPQEPAEPCIDAGRRALFSGMFGSPRGAS